jgi:hypothetical protein
MKRLLLFASLLAVVCGCSKDEPVAPTTRTVIAYMASDNDLSMDAFDDLFEMQNGFVENNANLVVFIDPADEAPYILEIAHKSSVQVKTYEEFNSADATQMQRVLNDIISMYPADNYGLILWSHGTSWLPAGSRLKSFGDDGTRHINIPELAAALPVHFDFIVFDACLMGSVEVAYELKDKTDFILASSTETIASGFPYDKIIPELLSASQNLRRAAEIYVNYYQQLDGDFRSATITLIDTRTLDDLAAVTRKFLSEQSFDITAFDRTAVQRLDVYDEQYTFDLYDFIDKAFPAADKSALAAQLNKTVLYKANTENWLVNIQYEIQAYCGLSCYIPLSGRKDLTQYYKTLRWYAASGFDFLF